MDYIFDFPRAWVPDWMRAQSHFQPDAEIHTPPIIAKEQKDIPDWLKHHHQWEPAVDVNKLKKYQLKVKMCCSKCAEKVVEEILEVYGVFDVRAEHLEKKVVVVATPNGLDEHEVLMKARKIHKKAKFVELDAKEKPKDNKKKPEDGEKGKENEGNKQRKERERNANKFLGQQRAFYASELAVLAYCIECAAILVSAVSHLALSEPSRPTRPVPLELETICLNFEDKICFICTSNNRDIP